MADKLKLLIAILIIVAGIFAFYYFDQWLQVARVGLVVGAIVLAALVAATSAQGKNALGFASKARSEGAKVVWPGRPEATQITGIVIAGAVIAALFIWLADTILFKVVYDLILGTQG